jgi:preprotein translocase subunit SecB
MNQKPQFPFSLINAFFITLRFERIPEIHDTINIPIEIQIKIIDKDFPRLQVNLRYKTPDDSPLKFDIELVGLFDYVGEDPERDHKIVNDFVREKGLHMLWPYVLQMARLITGQMGMSPIETKTPLRFDIQPKQENS